MRAVGPCLKYCYTSRIEGALLDSERELCPKCQPQPTGEHRAHGLGWMRTRARTSFMLLLLSRSVSGFAVRGRPCPATSLRWLSTTPSRVGTAAPRACSADQANSSGDLLVSAISGDGSISAKAIITTQLVAETSRLQGLGGLAAAALGRALSCSLLVAEGLKDEESFQVRPRALESPSTRDHHLCSEAFIPPVGVPRATRVGSLALACSSAQVNFRGDGPLRGVLAMANGKLEARGYVGNPAVTLPPNAQGKFDVGAGVGKGSLQVVRTKNLPGEEVSTPYTSITEIKTGEIPEDINWFLLDSEQKEGALAAGVYVQGVDAGKDLNGEEMQAASVLASGGWYVQLLPYADEEAVAQLQQNLAALSHRSPTMMIRDGLGAEEMSAMHTVTKS